MGGEWSFNSKSEQEFEQAFAEYHGAKYGIFMLNGTTTLECSLTALGVKAGDEVIVPALTWMATALAASYVGANRVIESLKRYIRMSNARDCSLERLEKFSGFSRYYLSHKFREYEGCTIGEYIDRVRILYTAAFRQGLRQKEIAAELGFSSPSNFWIWLRKHKKEIESAKINSDI